MRIAGVVQRKDDKDVSTMCSVRSAEKVSSAGRATVLARTYWSSVSFLVISIMDFSPQGN